MTTRWRARAQATLEFALAFPAFMLVVAAAFQLGMIYYAYWGQARLARDTARWLSAQAGSVSSDAVANYAATHALPGLVGGTPVLVSAGSNTSDAQYTIGKLTLSFTPCVAGSSSSSPCSIANRQPNGTISVQTAYDAQYLIFLPLPIPTTLPATRASLLAE
jgi:Flp pilus assembly protein TadG